jgi:hypothetical protein
LHEFASSIEELLVGEGLVSREDLDKILEKNKGSSAPRALLQMQLMDEEQFTSVWERFSGLKSIVVTPEDVPLEELNRWQESDAVRFGGMPCAESEDGSSIFGFVEPPKSEDLGEIAVIFGAPVEARLIPPSNFTSLRNTIYPRRVLVGQPISPLDGVFRSLNDANQRNVREFQMTRRRTLSDAMTHLGFIPAADVRSLYSESLGFEGADFSKLTLSISIMRTLGPLFCEVHGLLPLNDGSIGVMNPIHPDTAARIQNLLGSAIPFRVDTPSAFMKMWHDFMVLQFSQDFLIENLVESKVLLSDHAARVKKMQRLIEGPADRLLVQLGLVNKKQLFQAMRQTSGLEVAQAGDAPIGLEAEELLAPGFAARSGIAIHQIRDTGITFRLANLPSENDLIEVMERCAGMPVSFEIQYP